MLSNYSKSEIIERECLDPFDNPEYEALDVFVNESLCIGVGCPYSCVERAPHAFSFSSSTGTARATTQGFLLCSDSTTLLTSLLDISLSLAFCLLEHV
ncbi:hypothetical protein LIER_43513 [Lithospermum erythrorhizon]|uniref:Uncharacterized protein n=1 Tax=Lithospermum erythrorhizon TaxID=34254 RepID=A0AAV3Q7Z5_LITER